MVSATSAKPQPSTSGTTTKVISKPKPKVKSSTHPPVAKMINDALKSLENRKGSSVQAIKKYIEGKFIVDPVKVNPIIKRYLKKAVESKVLIQTKGIGATGSFKLAAKSSKTAITKIKHVTGSEEITKSTPSKETVKKPTQKKISKTEIPKKIQKKSSKTVQKKSPKTVAKKTPEKKVSRTSIAGTSDGKTPTEVKTRLSRSSIA